MIDANSEALRKYEAQTEQNERNYNEIEQLIETRLDDTIEEIKTLICEIDGYEYGVDAKEMVVEHLENLI